MMIVQKPSFRLEVFGTETTVVPFAFSGQDDQFSPQKGAFHPFPLQAERSKELENCFVGWVKNTPVLRSATINSLEKTKDFLELAEVIHSQEDRNTPLRICSDQKFALHTEWDQVVNQHQHLVSARKPNLVHLATALDPLISLHPPKRLAESDLRALLELPKMLNMEAWVSYLAWYNEILEQAFAGFKYDAVDEYTLERHLSEFHHEVNNLYLKESYESLLEVQLSMGKKEKTYTETVKMEKELIVLRRALQKMVGDHYDHLKEIVRIIPIIESAHPELSALKMTGKILATLIAPEVNAPGAHQLLWAQKEILLQCLNDELGVISAINDDHGVDRASVAFALRLAVLQTASRYGSEKVIDLAINFQEDMSHSETRVQVHKCLNLSFVENLKSICIPIASWNRTGLQEVTEGQVYFNQEVLSLLRASADAEPEISQLLHSLSLLL